MSYTHLSRFMNVKQINSDKPIKLNLNHVLYFEEGMNPTETIAYLANGEVMTLEVRFSSLPNTF